MKILMIIKQLRYAGAYKMFMWVAKSLAEKGYEVIIFTYLPNLPEIKEIPGVMWIKKDLSKSNFIKRVNEIRSIVREYKPDCSISFLLDANVYNILACLRLETKSIICERNDPFKPKYYIIHLLKPLFRFSDGAVFQLKKVQMFYSGIKKPTAIIPNPVLQNSVIEIDSFMQREDIVVTLGRLDIFQKRQDVLISAFSKFVKDYPQFKLLVYGDGPDIDKLNNIINNLDLKEKICLCGVTSNAKETIKDAKIFVLSSDFEGIPNALIEAMSLGLPCISTDCSPGGASLLIKDGVNGFLVPKANSDSIYNKLVEMVGNPSLCDQIGSEAKKIAIEFSEDQIIQLWITYLNQLCN